MLLQIKQDHEGPGPSLSLGIEAGKKWYKAMGDGAAAAGSYVSYCGMTPRVLMNSVSIAASTHARASHDYVPGQVRVLALIRPFHFRGPHSQAAGASIRIGDWPMGDWRASSVPVGPGPPSLHGHVDHNLGDAPKPQEVKCFLWLVCCPSR